MLWLIKHQCFHTGDPKRHSVIFPIATELLSTPLPSQRSLAKSGLYAKDHHGHPEWHYQSVGRANEDPLSQWGLRHQCGSYTFLVIASLLGFLLMGKIISLTWTLHLAANPGPMVVETCMYFKATGAPYFSFLAVNHQMPKLQGFHYWHRDANKSC